MTDRGEAQQHVFVDSREKQAARSKERRGEGEERERQHRATRSPAVSALARSRVRTVSDAIFTGGHEFLFLMPTCRLQKKKKKRF